MGKQESKIALNYITNCAEFVFILTGTGVIVGRGAGRLPGGNRTERLPCVLMIRDGEVAHRKLEANRSGKLPDHSLCHVETHCAGVVESVVLRVESLN